MKAGGGSFSGDRKKGTGMEILILLGFLLGWFALQAWILPRFGVST